MIGSPVPGRSVVTRNNFSLPLTTDHIRVDSNLSFFHPSPTMQATRAAVALRAVRTPAVRRLATTANPAAHTTESSSPAPRQSSIPLSNIAAQWENLSTEEKHSVYVDLDALQKKDWSAMSVDEKRAGMLRSSAYHL